MNISIEQFPNEILQIIFDNLDCETLLHIKSVNKFIYNFLKSERDRYFKNDKMFNFLIIHDVNFQILFENKVLKLFSDINCLSHKHITFETIIEFFPNSKTNFILIMNNNIDNILKTFLSQYFKCDDVEKSLLKLIDFIHQNISWNNDFYNKHYHFHNLSCSDNERSHQLHKKNTANLNRLIYIIILINSKLREKYIK